MPELNYIVSAPPEVSVPVAGTDQTFPVRRIYCVGRNYADHVREMGGDERQPPFFFQKPRDAVVLSGQPVPYAALTSDFHHEVEMVLAVGKPGSDIAAEKASDHIVALAVGIDLTRRDLQFEARNAGRPWEIGKAFDHSAPIGELQPCSGSDLSVNREISLSVNGVVRQHSDVQNMIWTPAEIVSRLSKPYRLEPGDLIYTGTPAGVGAVAVGDVLEARIAGLPPLMITIVANLPSLTP
jgi:fumarylpyruvate hydrolase